MSELGLVTQGGKVVWGKIYDMYIHQFVKYIQVGTFIYPFTCLFIHFSKYKKIGVLPICGIQCLTFWAKALCQREICIVVVHQLYYVLICVSTLPTQYTTFITHSLLLIFSINPLQVIHIAIHPCTHWFSYKDNGWSFM